MPATPLPTDWPQLSSALYYDAPAAAIDWLVRAFGFEVRMKVVGDAGEIHHSELVYGQAMIMVAGATRDVRSGSPGMFGGRNTQSLMLYVEDADAHCERARAGGAVILKEPADVDYGPEHWADRGYEALDCEGHRWWFAQRLRAAK